MVDDLLAFVRENPGFSIFATTIYSAGFVVVIQLAYLNFRAWQAKKRRSDRK